MSIHFIGVLDLLGSRLCLPSSTWLRMWPSKSSAIRLFMAPLQHLGAITLIRERSHQSFLPLNAFGPKNQLLLVLKVK